MRSWFVSSLLLLWSAWAEAADVREGFQCLGWTDLECAREVLEDLPADAGPERDLLEARLLFHEGDFTRAAELLRGVVPRADRIDPRRLAGQLPRGAGVGEEADPAATLRAGLEQELGFYVATADIHTGLVRTVVGDVVVVHHPGIERLLVDEAVEAINLARERIAPRIGGDVPGQVQLEIYPDGQSFMTASGLPEEAIRTTGVVAISKWGRLLVTSPRVLSNGYDWKNTVVHEWIHRVVSYNGRENAPIWLQEGIAKNLETLWSTDTFVMPVRNQSLLAGALQTGNWVSFEQMHPSMALLPTADMAGLAYAQVASLMAYLQHTTDPQALVRVIRLVREGVDARDAVARVANGGDFGAFEAAWKTWLAKQPLVGVKIAATPTDLDNKTEAYDADPVLARRKDLANLTRLGELLAEREHYEAALGYLQAAAPQDEPPGPLLTLRTAEVLNALGRPDEAIAVLVENLKYYPDSGANQRLLGELYLAQDRDADALRAFRAAADITPFDPTLHEHLAALYRAAGKADLARRHQGYLDILYYRDNG